MTIFIESPWPILLIGIGAEAVLAIMLLRTGRGRLLWAMVGVAAFVVAGLLVEHFVVTDRKAVTQTLEEARAAVVANDLQRLLNCISPTAPTARRDADWMLHRVEVNQGSIHQLEITVNRLTSPPSARARLVAVGAGRDRMNEFPYNGFYRRVVVNLRREGDRWLITDYDVEDFHAPH
jgi:hypothetical protein